MPKLKLLMRNLWFGGPNDRARDDDRAIDSWQTDSKWAHKSDISICPFGRVFSGHLGQNLRDCGSIRFEKNDQQTMSADSHHEARPGADLRTFFPKQVTAWNPRKQMTISFPF
jgi:hypothetical protein